MTPRRTVWLATLAALACATPPAISGPLPLPQDPNRPKPDLKVRVELAKERRPDGVRVRMLFRVINAGAGPEVGVLIRKPCTQFADRANVGGKIDQAFALTGDVAQTSKEEQSCHPPVTDMWRAVAGARRRSM